MAECVFQRLVENVNADVGELLDCVPVPSHLLLICHPFGDDLVNRRFSEPGRYSGSIPIALAVVWHGIRVRFEIANHIQ